jgi:hypothetical protein
MNGIQFVTDEKGRKVGVLIDLKKRGAIWQDFWDGLVSESRRNEKGIPYEQYRATRLKRTRPRGQVLSKSSSRRKRNWTRWTMRCLLA